MFKADIFITDYGFGFDDFKIYEAGSITTGTEAALKSESIKVYPNPGNGIYNLQIPASTQPTFVKVYDLKGSILTEKKITAGETAAQINITNAPKGIYVLKTQTGNKVHTQKIELQ